VRLDCVPVNVQMIGTATTHKDDTLGGCEETRQLWRGTAKAVPFQSWRVFLQPV